jgi:dolichol-phosphate mannosyltransferase
VPEAFQGEGFTIVLPTYNEAGNIARMVGHLRDLYPQAQVLVMDDDSPDGTGELVNRLFSSDAGVKVVVRRGSQRGLSASVVQGISECDTPFFIVMDADFQHPPAEAGGLMSALSQGADVCVAVRRDRNALGKRRKLYSQGAEFLSRCYLWLIDRQSSRDNMSGFFGGRSEMITRYLSENENELEPAGFKILFDILKFLPRDASLAEWEYDFGVREEGESKIGSGIIVSILRQCGTPGRALASVYRRLSPS